MIKHKTTPVRSNGGQYSTKLTWWKEDTPLTKMDAYIHGSSKEEVEARIKEFLEKQEKGQ